MHDTNVSDLLRSRSVDEDLALYELEKSFHDGLKCEGNHYADEGDFCSIEVTHRFFACYVEMGKFICSSGVSRVKRWGDAGASCRVCGCMIRECWVTRPI